jgi:glycogen debranching enzyme
VTTPTPTPADIFEASPTDTRITRATDLTGVLVLKHDARFLVSDPFGDVRPGPRGLGLYAGDTRVLSTYEMRVNAVRPVVLRTGSSASYGSTIQMTNPDLLRDPRDKQDPDAVLRRQSLGVVRERLLSDAFEERIRIDNYTLHPERCALTLRLDADYADIFEVRGVVRARRGERGREEVDGDTITFSYVGLDGHLRRTSVTSSEPFRLLPAGMAERDLERCVRDGLPWPDAERRETAGEVLVLWDWEVAPGAHRSLRVTVTSDVAPGPRRGTGGDRPRALSGQEAEAAHRAWYASSTGVETSHAYADRAFRRALADLRLLVNSGPGPGERYIAAGVPWFSTLFGRDAIITALQTLAIRPQIAQETLSVLARLQATEEDPWRDAQPGKILHEWRSGELALAGEIPHTPYYGSIDATPLWLMLLDAYERWTADSALVDRLWPNALAAVRWIEEWADADGDGFLEYERRSPSGLVNQGWKDSTDSNRFRDGRLASAPLALVEVQAYAHAARMAVARLARVRGEDALAARQEEAARVLADRFEERFWMEDVGTYAMALDAEKRPVDAVSSNPGHVLWCGIASPERARRVVTSLVGPELWSGWGIRTLAETMRGYNPIGYHIGTIWPHDNGIAAAGMLRYGFREEASRVAGALLEATAFFRDARLPELFCGFDRARSPYPVPYPVACFPQAWAAGSLFQLLAATLGLEPDAAARRLVLRSPTLPPWLPDVRLQGLRVGDAVVDLLIRGSDGSTAVEVVGRTGELSVVVTL